MNISKFDQTLLTASSDLKEFINRYTNYKEFFDLQERHDNMELNANKNFFSDNYIVDIFMFMSAIVSLLVTTLTIFLLCKHKKLQTLLASLILYQVKEVGAEVTQKEINFECRTLAYIGITLTALSLTMVTFLHYRKSKGDLVPSPGPNCRPSCNQPNCDKSMCNKTSKDQLIQAPTPESGIPSNYS